MDGVGESACVRFFITNSMQFSPLTVHLSVQRATTKSVSTRKIKRNHVGAGFPRPIASITDPGGENPPLRWIAWLRLIFLALTDFVVVAIPQPRRGGMFIVTWANRVLAPAGRHPLLADVAPDGAWTDYFLAPINISPLRGWRHKIR